MLKPQWLVDDGDAAASGGHAEAPLDDEARPVPEARICGAVLRRVAHRDAHLHADREPEAVVDAEETVLRVQRDEAERLRHRLGIHRVPDPAAHPYPADRPPRRPGPDRLKHALTQAKLVHVALASSGRCGLASVAAPLPGADPVTGREADERFHGGYISLSSR